MRRLIRTGAILVLAAVVFLLGAATATTRGWGQASALIDVRNASGAPLRSIEIAFETCGGRKARITESAPPPDAVLAYAIALCGEGGYTIQATLADGSTVSSRGAYLENGYRVTEVVERTGITTTPHFYRP